MSNRTIVESIYEGEFLQRTINEVWDFLDYSSGNTYEWKTIREIPSLDSLIYIANGGQGTQ